MNYEILLWIAVAAYSAHILEEFTYDWKSWMTDVLAVQDEILTTITRHIHYWRLACYGVSRPADEIKGHV